MGTAADLLSTSLSRALGWTLLHSFWISAVVWLVVSIALRIVPSAYGLLRYRLATGGLLGFMLAIAITFNMLSDNRSSDVVSHPAGVTATPAAAIYSLPAAERWAGNFMAFVDAHMSAIILMWMTGTLFFMTRLGAGIYATFRLKATARPVPEVWSQRLQRLAKKLGIKRVIMLAESARVSSPVVIGYFKPVILLPIGMFTGLTTEQLETVFIHELAHIQRRDYLVNLLQTIVEAIFFFNPFVWLLSGDIRREREYCCDDVVLKTHGGNFAYAQALAVLASMRLGKHTIALPLGETRNELLQRIRRVMEKPGIRCAANAEKILLPTALLMAGLLSVSWLATHSEGGFGESQVIASQDRTGRKAVKVASYSRKTITQFDEKGQVYQNTVGEFKGDEPLRPLVQRSSPTVPQLSDVAPLSGGDQGLTTDAEASTPFDNKGEWGMLSRMFERQFQRNVGHMAAWTNDDLFSLMRAFEETTASEEWLRQALSHKNIRRLDDSTALRLFRKLEKIQELRMDDFQRRMRELEENMLRLEEMNFREFGLRAQMRLPDGGIPGFEQMPAEILIDDDLCPQFQTAVLSSQGGVVVTIIAL